jgi:hypothetical protein
MLLPLVANDHVPAPDGDGGFDLPLLPLVGPMMTRRRLIAHDPAACVAALRRADDDPIHISALVIAKK